MTGPAKLPSTKQQPQTEDGTRPEDFRVSGTDQKGHSERTTVRIQPGHVLQLNTTLKSRVWPYRTGGDIIRHALVRHFRWLETLAPIPSVTAQVDAVGDLLRDEEFQADFEALFERLSTRVGAHMSAGHMNQASSLLMDVKRDLERMPPGDWRDRYLETLNTKFKGWLNL